MGFFSSGSAAVDAMGRIEISGNIIPQKWYRVILRDNGKPDLLAIILLSDIVYWYRPVEVRDEASGNAIGWRKKFKSDLLQKTYEQYADQFGESKRTIKAALDRLEELGLIKKVFRNITLSNGTKIPNVMFIALNPDRVNEITHEDIDPETFGPAVQKSEDVERRNVDNFGDNSQENEENQGFVGYGTKFCRISDKKMYDPLQENVTPPTSECTHLPQKNVGYPASNCGTNTENTTTIRTEITPENTTEINDGEYSQVLSSLEEDGSEEEEVHFSRPIQVTMEKQEDRQTDRDIYIEFLKDQVQYDRILEEDTYGDKINIVDGIINIIADIATTVPPDGYERVNGRQYPHEVVKSRLLKMDYDTLIHVLERFKENKTEIRNMRSYLLTALYNAKDEKDIQFQNFFNHSYYNTDWTERRRKE